MLGRAWPAEDVYYVAQRGHLLYREGRLREAFILFQGLIAVDPENAYCRRALAAIATRLGQHWLAVRHLSALIAHDGEDADAIAARCEALIAVGDFAAARRDLDSLAAFPAGIENAPGLRLRLLQHAVFTPAAEAPQLPAGPSR